MVPSTLRTSHQSVKLDRGDPILLAQCIDDAQDGRPIRFQQGEHFVFRASDDLGNALGVYISIEWNRTVLMAADRQARLKPSGADSVPINARTAGRVLLDTRREVTSDLHL